MHHDIFCHNDDKYYEGAGHHSVIMKTTTKALAIICGASPSIDQQESVSLFHDLNERSVATWLSDLWVLSFRYGKLFQLCATHLSKFSKIRSLKVAARDEKRLNQVQFQTRPEEMGYSLHCALVQPNGTASWDFLHIWGI